MLNPKFRWTLCGLYFAAVSSVFAADAPPEPKLIVTLTVDQFSAGIFDQYRGQFSGGLRRLIDQGVVFPNGYQTHAATETCPGHSTILTGRHPSATGIIGNGWLNAETGAKVYCVEDATTTVPGRPKDPRGPSHLRSSTLGEWLKARNAASRTVAVSGKDRAAITMAGHDPTAVFWWDDERGFNTYVPHGGDEAERLAPVKAFNEALTQRWTQSRPRWAPLKESCSALNGKQTYGEMTVDHRVPTSWKPLDPSKPWREDPAFKTWFKASPGLDRITLDLAVSLLERYKLGRGVSTDVLAISLSATDYVGHRYGNQGPEMCDQLAHLDRILGAFLTKLDALKLPYVVALTADHGAADAAERVAQRGFSTHRFVSDLVADTNKAVREALSLTYDPLKGDAQGLYVTRRDTADAALRERIATVALAAVITRPDVVAAFTKEAVLQIQLPINKPADELSLIERFAESVDAERSPDILIALQPYLSLGKPKAPENYIAGHGSPWNYDRRVPILFWWPGVQGYEQYLPIETVDIAPTLAALVGLSIPPVDGRCLDLNRGAGSTCPLNE